MATGEFTATEVSISDPVKGLTVRSWDGPAYKPILDFGTWRIAGLNHAERFSESARVKKSRHLTTDEAFILIEGEATLYVGDDLTPVKMKKNKVGPSAIAVKTSDADSDFPRRKIHDLELEVLEVA